MKLHEMLIGGLFVTVLFVGIMMFYAEGAAEYGSGGIDTSSISGFNDSLYSIQSDAANVQNAMTNLSGNPSLLDIFGSVSIGTLAGLNLAGSSMGVLWNVFTQGIGTLPIGDLKGILVLFAGASLTIIFFIAIIAHFVRPSDRL